jgi:hypothetical protein
VKAAPGRPVLSVIRPADVPDHRHGPRWWWFRVTEAWETVRWHILTAVAAMVARVVPRAHGQAWAGGFDTALDRGVRHRPGRHRPPHLENISTAGARATRWRSRSSTAGTGSVGRAQVHPLLPFVLPDSATLSDLVADVAEEQLEYSGAARAEVAFEQARQAAARPGRHRWHLRRIDGAVALMATATVDARNHRVTAPADVVDPWRVVVIEGRHAATPGHPGRPRSDGRQRSGRHARPRWRSLAARWLRDAIGWREAGAHRTTNGPLRTAA